MRDGQTRKSGWFTRASQSSFFPTCKERSFEVALVPAVAVEPVLLPSQNKKKGILNNQRMNFGNIHVRITLQVT